MIGIYKFENKINHHIYIGQSIDLKQRYLAHKSSAFNPKASDYNSQLHQAMRKYGFKNFTYEIVAIIEASEYTNKMLNDLEKYFIKYYNSFHNGYNATEGGDTNPLQKKSGELNGRAKLTLEDVKYIRECYNAHIPFKEVYDEYKNIISKRGLQKVWWFDNWKDVYPEYHTEENKYWHSHQAKANTSKAASNNKRVFTEAQVKAMRKDYDDGMSPKQVWLKYAPNRAWSTVYNIITRQTYKDIK